VRLFLPVLALLGGCLVKVQSSGAEADGRPADGGPTPRADGSPGAADASPGAADAPPSMGGCETTPCDEYATCVDVDESFRCEALVGVEVRTGRLVRLHPSTYETLQTIPVQVPGQTIDAAHGLAVDASGTLFALLRPMGQGSRLLVTLDAATGAASLRGDTGLRLSSIAFDPAGALYATTGDGETPPETLFRLDLASGAPTQVGALGRGTDGEVIALGGDGQLYHWSGWSGGGLQVFERLAIDGGVTATDIPFSVTPPDEIASAIWSPETGSFLCFDLSEQVQSLTPAGELIMVGQTEASLKGVAVVRSFAPHRLEPASGPAAGGTLVTLHGAGFQGAGPLTVGFDGQDAGSVTVVDDRTLTAISPPGSGTVDVTVRAGTVTRARYPGDFRYE
jgi:hypothetical protein